MQNAAIVLLTLVNTLLVSLSQIALWQRKEYRIDRMQSYLDSPEGSLKKQWAPLIAGLLVGIGWMMLLLNTGAFADYFGIASLAAVLCGHAMRVYTKGLVRPTLTMRSGIVLLGTAIACMAWGSYLIIPYGLLALQLATFMFFLPATIVMIVLLSAVPTEIQKRRGINRARALRKSLSSLTVVGITGSVGKTSTKTYLLHLLGGTSNTVMATREHRNSPYAVAQDMLVQLTKKTKIYIAEMGAYKKGEIAELAQLTRPTVGVITAITNQHVALFGSLQKLADAKWELVDALPSDGIAVLNADDETVIQKSKKLNKKIVWFSTRKKADVYFKKNILTIQDEAYELELPVIGKGQVASAIAAAAAAHALGIPGTTITKKLSTLPALARTMEVKKGIHGSRIIDDSYSASEASVMNAIEYVDKAVEKDTRLILVPIIELGSEGPAVHARIGKAVASTSAKVYIYGDAYKKDIQQGLGRSPKANVVWFHDAKDMAQKVAKDVTSETVIVLEGRLPNIIREAIV